MLTRLAIVGGEEAGIRLDTFLARYSLCSGVDPPSVKAGGTGLGRLEVRPGLREVMAGLSRSAIQKLIARGQVTVNGRRTKAGGRLKVSDRVEVQWSPPMESALKPEPLPLQILYEDEDLVVVNKPPGMVVHPAAGNLHGTLVNALLYYCPNLQGIGGERRPGIVHRLDKGTSGAMVVAKHERAFPAITLQFKERRVTKEYVAFVWGRVDGRVGIINQPIGRHWRDRKRMSSIRSLSPLREAVTEWKVERSFCLSPRPDVFSWVTLLRLRPHTGRTHQIRVHLADQGYPVVGDGVYGRKKKGSYSKTEDVEVPGLMDFPRQALHAERLKLFHPCTGAPVEFLAPWFPDMKGLLELLKGECVGPDPKF